MTFFDGLFNQTAVAWAPGATNSAGNNAWEAGAEIVSKVRWEDGKGLVRTSAGDSITYDATVYTEGAEAITNRYRIYQGALSTLTAAQKADPTKTADSWTVVYALNSPSVDAENTLKKLYLRAP